MPAAAPSPALSFVDDCLVSGSDEQMFGEKQQIRHGEQKRQRSETAQAAKQS
jgi:hypothetical protein